MSLTPRQVVEILERLSESDCESFHLQLGDSRIDYRRAGVASVPPPASRDAARTPERKPTAASPPAPVANPDPAPAAPASAPAATGAALQGQQIAAPMAGVFYRRPSPEEPPFVEVGSTVQAGDPVCVIEVMKLFSTVHADVAGRVVAIHVDDAASVEPNQPLFSIEPVEA